jgi:AmpD protein
MGRILPIRAPTRARKRLRHGRLGLEAATGLLRGARQVASPNCDDRPPGMGPDLIVIHGISLPPGQFGGPHIDELFTSTLDPAGHPYFVDIAGLTVSSHALIRRNGEVVQYVPVHRRAWHAGKSSYRGRPQCNDFSVGIELEGTDDHGYTAAQYRRLATLIRVLRQGVPSLSRAPIVGHSDVAPGRKTDPGPAFQWARLHKLLAQATGRQR